MDSSIPEAGLRPVLNARLNRGGPGGASYYAFSPHPAWRIVVLDGYDVSLLGWPEHHPQHRQACRILAERNPNQVCMHFQSLFSVQNVMVEKPVCALLVHQLVMTVAAGSKHAW